ncbi:MAG: VOC family protein [Candidatus Rariloculaceae bacterium]
MTSDIRIRKLDHVVIRAREPERMVAFYCDVLGCTLEKYSTAVAGLVHLRAGDSLLDIMPAADALPYTSAAATNRDHFCLQVEPFDQAKLQDYLDTHGVEYGDFGPRYGADGDGLSVYIRDPQGNEVELKAPPSGV